MNRSQNNSKERISLDVQAMDRFNREEGLIVKKGSFVPELTNYKYPTLRSLPKEERQSSRVILRDLKIVVGVGQYDEEEYRVFEQIPIYQENFEKRCRSHIGFNGGKNGFSNERASALCWDVFDEKFGNDLTNVAGDIRSKYNGEKMLPTDDVELQALILSVLHHPSGEENDWSISECKKLKEAVFDLIDPKLGNISTAVIERFKENKMPIDCQFYLFETVQQFIDKKPKTMQAKKDQKKKKLKE